MDRFMSCHARGMKRETESLAGGKPMHTSCFAGLCIILCYFYVPFTFITILWEPQTAALSFLLLFLQKKNSLFLDVFYVYLSVICRRTFAGLKKCMRNTNLGKKVLRTSGMHYIFGNVFILVNQRGMVFYQVFVCFFRNDSKYCCKEEQAKIDFWCAKNLNHEGSVLTGFPRFQPFARFSACGKAYNP